MLVAEVDECSDVIFRAELAGDVKLALNLFVDQPRDVAGHRIGAQILQLEDAIFPLAPY
jgi:hypothetical protein